MPSFVYQARDSKGERVSGAREAASQQEALNLLRAAGLFVTKLAPATANEVEAAAAPTTINSEAPSVNGSSDATLPSHKWELAADTSAESTVTRKAPTETPKPAPAKRPNVERGYDPLRTPPVPRASSEAQRERAEPPKPREAAPQSTQPPLTPQAVLPSQSLAPLPPRYFLRSNAKDLSLFWSQMHSMLHAGVSISHAVETMAANAPNKALREACGEMAPRIASGVPFSDLMEAFPGIFSPLMIGMIRAGEMGGFLDRMCLRLATYAERDYHIQQTIKRETWYPKLVVFASIFIPALPPVAIALFKGGNVWAAFLAAMLSTVPAVCVVGGVWFLWKFNSLMLPLAARTNGLRYAIDQVKLLLPIAGKTARALSTAKFCRSLGALQSAGTGMNKTITLAADACGNAVLAEQSRRAIPRIESGQTLTEALSATGQFPGIAIQMLRTGEATGSFDEQLEKVADFLESDAETTIKQSVALLGVLALVFVGIRVCMQLVQFYTGYFDNIFDTVDSLSK
jgi:type II secretory pathway component PulF